MSPKIVNRQEKKTEVALIALETFVDVGFEKTTISEIAKRANIAKGSIYDYFSSKEELVLYTIKLCLELFENSAPKAVHQQDAERHLRDFIQRGVQTWLKDERTVKISAALFHMMLSRQMPDKYKHMIFRHFLRASEMIERIIYKGIEQGVFRKELKPRVKDISINLLAYMDGISLYHFVDNKRIKIERQIEIYLDSFIRGLKP